MELMFTSVGVTACSVYKFYFIVELVDHSLFIAEVPRVSDGL